MANEWLPLKTGTGPIRHLYITRPGEYVAPPPPIGRMVYLFFGTQDPLVVTWSPLETLPQYVVVDKFGQEGNTDGPVRASSGMHRFASALTARDANRVEKALPPGFTSMSLFGTGHPPSSADTGVKGTWTQRIMPGFSTNHWGWYYNRTLANICSAWITKDDGSGNVRCFGSFGGAKGNPMSHANATESEWHVRPGDILLPRTGDSAQNWEMGTVNRIYGPATYIRGWTYWYHPYPDYTLGYLYHGLDANGAVTTVVHGGTGKEIYASPSAARAVAYSNEYIYIPYLDKLYYWPEPPPNLPDPIMWVPFSDYVEVTTLPVRNPSIESFDTYWVMTSPGGSSWALWRRNDSQKQTFVKKADAATPPEMIAHLDAYYGGSWSPTGVIGTTNLTNECVFVVTGSPPAGAPPHRLMLLRDDLSWQDVSGNLWDDYEGAPRVAPAANTSISYIRHVLTQEFNPYQGASV